MCSFCYRAKVCCGSSWGLCSTHILSTTRSFFKTLAFNTVGDTFFSVNASFIYHLLFSLFPMSHHQFSPVLRFDILFCLKETHGLLIKKQTKQKNNHHLKPPTSHLKKNSLVWISQKKKVLLTRLRFSFPLSHSWWEKTFNICIIVVVWSTSMLCKYFVT